MGFLYNLTALAFLMLLFYGYGGFDILSSLLLTIVSFAASVVGFIKGQTIGSKAS